LFLLQENLRAHVTSILLRCNVLVEDHGPGNATMRVRGGPPAAGPFDRAYAPTPSLAPHMGNGGGHGSNGGGGGAINGSHHGGGGGSLSVSTYVLPNPRVLLPSPPSSSTLTADAAAFAVPGTAGRPRCARRGRTAP